jgi:hypothetical protein
VVRNQRSSVAVGLVRAGGTVDFLRGTVATFAPRTANRPPQKLGLLVLLLRKAVPATELLLTATRTWLSALLGVLRTRSSVRIAAAIEALLVAATVVAFKPVIVPVMIAVTPVPILIL